MDVFVIAGLRRNITTHRQPYKSEFQSCLFGEACIIAYKCHEGFLKSSQDKKPIEQDKGNATLHKHAKKCKEDIFKNTFVCCKIGTVNSGSRPHGNVHSRTTTTTTPTYRPTTVTPVSTTSTSFESAKEGIYKNNYLLTNTLAPTRLPSAETDTADVTESSLITGLGLRFHSHLHTKSAIRANEAKPNPYLGGSQLAIIPLKNNETTFATEVSGNFSEKSSNSIELLGSASNSKSVNQTLALDFQELEKNVSTKNDTVEISDKGSTNYSADLHTQNNETFNSTVEIFSKVDVNKIPESVPLSEEYSTYPPFGFIFKGQDLYIPDVDIPSQNFLPPLYEYGETKEDIVIEEAVGVTEDDLTETTTVSDTNSLGELIDS